ncbi:bacteriohemerythrin [Eubacterium sp. MSJ-13]|uniref:bacteriohemerythrin n=1 Tax=Eubacterium sp. MSJ-13 TaxID=2841513 RepID=UPI001C111708|nr:bacteriohemerythrin [Eubacterium sp. MSJ-13]MBU5478427.1 bacteriohemerythrin [Eubacterium sp. MSJ-13]
MYEFTKDCMIGIKEIDDEHKKLFDMINDAIALADKTDDVKSIANNLIKNLKDYANVHFAHEEAYMKKINDPELESQIKEHKAFAKKVNSFELDTSSDEASKKSLNDILVYIIQWLYKHILGSDIMIGKLSDHSEEAENDNPFEFTDKYKTDIALIDDEHRHLFEIIEKTNELIHENLLHDKYDEIMHLLDELKTYTETHFNDEEALMEKISYPGLAAQKKAHAAFVDKLVHIDINELDEIDEHQQAYLFELINYLLSWLSNHILGSDLKIGEYIRENNISID